MGQETLAVKNEAQRKTNKIKRKQNRREIYKRAKNYAKEYHTLERAEIAARRQAKDAGNFHVPAEAKVAVVIRIRGIISFAFVLFLLFCLSNLSFCSFCSSSSSSEHFCSFSCSLPPSSVPCQDLPPAPIWLSQTQNSQLGCPPRKSLQRRERGRRGQGPRPARACSSEIAAAYYETTRDLPMYSALPM